jgi:hypothetical protein
MAGAESDEMKRAKINKVQMARRMNTCRAALDRLLDPGNASVTLQTLCRAARAIGRDLRSVNGNIGSPRTQWLIRDASYSGIVGLLDPIGPTTLTETPATV